MQGSFMGRVSQPYNPLYDPMTDVSVGRGSAYAPTYWIGTAGTPPADDGPVTGDMDVDVVVIGSGYTGLSCALHLAKEFGIKAHVLEANGVAYGCSTRNGGQAQISAGRLKRSQWMARWGLDVARGMHAEMSEAFDLFRGLLRDHAIDCEPQDGGHYYIAHRPWMMPTLAKEAALLRDTFGYGARMLSRDELFQTAVRDMEAHGAMWDPDGTAIHAAKLAFGYLRAARELGAKVHVASPVEGWTTQNGIHHLRTPGGTVRARAVAVATAGYAPRGLHPRLRDRLMPILSNSITTRPLASSMYSVRAGSSSRQSDGCDASSTSCIVRGLAGAAVCAAAGLRATAAARATATATRLHGRTAVGRRIGRPRVAGDRV